jgi:hypothetical protein
MGLGHLLLGRDEIDVVDVANVLQLEEPGHKQGVSPVLIGCRDVEAPFQGEFASDAGVV